MIFSSKEHPPAPFTNHTYSMEYKKLILVSDNAGYSRENWSMDENGYDGNFLYYSKEINDKPHS